MALKLLASRSVSALLPTNIFSLSGNQGLLQPEGLGQLIAIDRLIVALNKGHSGF
jgi:hypothetical protein